MEVPIPQSEVKASVEDLVLLQVTIEAKPAGTGDLALNIFAKSLARILGYGLCFSLDLIAKSSRQNDLVWVQSALGHMSQKAPSVYCI